MKDLKDLHATHLRNVLKLIQENITKGEKQPLRLPKLWCDEYQDCIDQCLACKVKPCKRKVPAMEDDVFSEVESKGDLGPNMAGGEAG